jgi:hypothetical protein
VRIFENDSIINDLKIHPSGRNDVHEMYIFQNSFVDEEHNTNANGQCTSYLMVNPIMKDLRFLKITKILQQTSTSVEVEYRVKNEPCLHKPCIIIYMSTL